MRAPGNRRSVVLRTVLDDECLVLCPLSTGFLHCSSVTSQEEVAQSEMVMFYLPNSTGVDRLPSGIASPMAPTRDSSRDAESVSFKNSVV